MVALSKRLYMCRGLLIPTPCWQFFILLFPTDRTQHLPCWPKRARRLAHVNCKANKVSSELFPAGPSQLTLSTPDQKVTVGTKGFAVTRNSPYFSFTLFVVFILAVHYIFNFYSLAGTSISRHEDDCFNSTSHSV